MAEYNESYKNIEVVEDKTDGSVELVTVQRHGSTRKTKIKNNFTGLLEPSNSKNFLHIAKLLNDELPEDDAIVVGMYKSGIIMAGYLALARESRLAWTTPDQIGDVASAVCFKENHWDSKAHYLYGLEPGDSVIIVEDEVSSGKGVAGFANELIANGIDVAAICSVIETLNFGGREHIRNECGIELVSLVKIKLS